MLSHPDFIIFNARYHQSELLAEAAREALAAEARGSELKKSLPQRRVRVVRDSGLRTPRTSIALRTDMPA